MEDRPQRPRGREAPARRGQERPRPRADRQDQPVRPDGNVAPAPARRRHRRLDRHLPALRRPGHRALRRIHRAARAARPGRRRRRSSRAAAVTVQVATDVAIYTLNQKRRELARIEAEYGMAITFEPKEGLMAGTFEIERTDAEDAGGKRQARRRLQDRIRAPARRGRARGNHRGRGRRGDRGAEGSGSAAASERPAAAATAGLVEASPPSPRRPRPQQRRASAAAARPAKPSASPARAAAVAFARRRKRAGCRRRGPVRRGSRLASRVSPARRARSAAAVAASAAEAATVPPISWASLWTR